MKFEIKHYYSGEVLFSLETATLKLCAEAAVKSGAILNGAILNGASLVGASLVGASLDGARLDGAILNGARLDGASLVGASLVGASLVGGERLTGARPILQIGPIGSRSDYLIAYNTHKGIRLRTGCFFGSVDQFRVKIEQTHNKTQHAADYEAALEFIGKIFKTPKTK